MAQKELDDTILFKITDWIAKLAYVNLLWVGFTIMGGVVLGLFPATVALFFITRKWVLGEKPVSLVKSFFQAFREDFWKANAIGYSAGALGVFLFTDVFLASTLDNAFGFWLTFFFSVLFILFLTMVVFLFPLFVHVKESFYHYFKFAFLIGLSSLHYLLFIITGSALAIALFAMVPAAAIFFAASVFAMIITLFSMKAFDRVENRKRGDGSLAS
ncbi:YesL family protein [Salipaludibacillus sp. HK11]|uniref:YesL family protein n=1 Tax=Salipaludibacillus sp. HK11 TaxID=3394320 RepID=UPI0039FC1C85